MRNDIDEKEQNKKSPDCRSVFYHAQDSGYKGYGVFGGVDVAHTDEIAGGDNAYKSSHTKSDSHRVLQRRKFETLKDEEDADSERESE